jgi:hypothetical protein
VNATELGCDDAFVCDFVEAWGSQFPDSRFTGLTVETARMSVGPQEVNVLVATALSAQLRLLSDALLKQRDLLRDSPRASTKHTRMAGLEEAAGMARLRADEIDRSVS